MCSRIVVWFLIFSIQISAILAETNSNDVSALNALKSSWSNLPTNWKGSDPCGLNWDGIDCDNSRVVSIKLSGMGLKGREFGDLASLSELQYLDLSNNIGLKGTLPSSMGNLKNLTTLILVGCSFSGPIPDSIGSLQQLVFLSLSSNSFNGPIPNSIGNLSNLFWLDLSHNEFTRSIPVSNGLQPGLDRLTNAKHFNLAKNQLSGTIPPKLFSSNMKLIRVSLDHNRLSGEIPETLGLVQTLEVVRLDSNSLNGSVPNYLNNLTSLNELNLSNNKLTGSIPDLAGMDVLHLVNMSSNSFVSSNIPPWFTNLLSLSTIHMANTNLRGPIPADFFSLPQLETVVFANNNLNGTLDIGNSYTKNMTLDLRNNSITSFEQKTGYNMEMMLAGNPICQGNLLTQKYCIVQ